MDPERERMRLVELYAGMSDGELMEIAEDWASLTDSAHLALKAELDRRGIKLETEEETPQEEDLPLVSDPVEVAQYTELGEAMMAKGFLESGGIPCELRDMNDKSIDPRGILRHITGAVGYAPTDFSFSTYNTGLKLLVNRVDADAASAALDRLANEEPKLDDGGAGETDEE